MYRTVLTAGEVRKYLSTAKTIAFDFETAPDEKYRDEDKAALDPHTAHIVGISFSKADGDAIYMPIAHKVGKNAAPLTKIWDWLAENFFVNPDITKVAHNLAFESDFFMPEASLYRNRFMTRLRQHNSPSKVGTNSAPLRTAD